MPFGVDGMMRTNQRFGGRDLQIRLKGAAMTASKRLREIEHILRDDPRTYWASPHLQRELRELLTNLHGGEHDPQSSAVGEPFDIEASEASSIVLAPDAIAE